MKVVHLIVSICVVSMSLSVNFSYARQPLKYRIAANIKGLPEDVMLYLLTRNENGKIDTVQSVQSKRNRFIFDLSGVEQNKMYFINTDTAIFKPKDRKSITLIVDAPSIKITGRAEEWPVLEISGSPATNVYQNYHKANSKYIGELNELMKELIKEQPSAARQLSPDELIQQAPGNALGLKAKQRYKEWKAFVNTYLGTHKNSPVIPLLIRSAGALDLQAKVQAYEALSDEIKTSFYGRELLAYITNEKHDLIVAQKQAELAVGKQMPDFKISTPDGKIVSVLEIASQSDYTLLDFWASWCVPCRSAIPKIKEVYEAYRSKGFNVIGVSTDKQETDWKKALEQENTRWFNGRDNIDHASKNIFGLAAIPGYILLDKNGVIIQTDYFTGKGGVKILKPGEKTLGNGLKGIMEELLAGK